jgi:WD40 repeat protein
MDEEPTRISPPNQTSVQTIDISPDGARVLIGQDGDNGRTANLTVWSLDSLTLEAELSRSDYELVLMARFSPGGDSVAYVDSSLRPMLLDLGAGSATALEVEDPRVQWLSFARDRARLVLSGDMAQVWDVDAARVIWKETVGPAPDDGDLPTAVADLSPDGTSVAVCRPGDEVIRMYDLDSGDTVQTLRGAPIAVRWLSLDPRGNYLAAIEQHSNGVFLWDLHTGARHLTSRFDATMEGYWSLRFHPGGWHLGLGMLSGYVEVVELEGGRRVWAQRIHAGRVWDVAFTPDGSRMASGGDDGMVYLLDSRVR